MEKKKTKAMELKRASRAAQRAKKEKTTDVLKSVGKKVSALQKGKEVKKGKKTLVKKSA